MHTPLKSLAGIAVTSILALTGRSAAQVFQPPRVIETAWPVNRTVGPLVNNGATRDAIDTIVAEIPRPSVIRLKFSSWTLPRGTAVRITSPATNEVAVMNDEVLTNWSGYSPSFNDRELIVELLADPHAAPAGYVLSSAIQMKVDTPPRLPGAGPTDEYCGADDRIRSSATAVGRFWCGGFCTASLIASGDAAVSAGHCAPGVYAASFVEFDPPDSVYNSFTMTYETVVGAVANQFPVDMQRIQWAHDPSSQAQDAFAFGLKKNTDLQTAGARRGDYMRIAQAPNVTTDFSATKWGCGVADNPGHLTMKYIDGTVGGTRVNEDGGMYWEYNIDASPGDSGGPLWHSGIHASVGVLSWGSPVASGCLGGTYAFSNPVFVECVRRVVGLDWTRFVDSRWAPVPGETVGTIWSPSTTFRANGYDTLPPSPSATLIVAPGTYSVGVTLSQKATIRAPFGPVTLMP